MRWDHFIYPSVRGKGRSGEMHCLKSVNCRFNYKTFQDRHLNRILSEQNHPSISILSDSIKIRDTSNVARGGVGLA